uniref:Cytochrome c biogenesis protein CcsA n=2 Tax=Vischeria TaxID=44431 RepID=A0A5P8SZM7_9STRA|nr:heme attachment to plastid cytochrome c [Vischeria punctata]AOW70889.1 heme attachment to plastid cytochrome c [Vischeria sp. CAUP Q 202]QFR99704.1 heme attachment to plastid cytochrome c [Vischeria stellata]UTV00891.1 heme attachment to plastid cytochrome c [Vischeria punctata]
MIELNTIQNFLMDATFYLLVGSTTSSWINLFFLESSIWSFIAKVSTFSSSFLLILLLLVRWQAGKYFPLSNLYESILFLCVILLIAQQLAELKLSTRLIKCLNLPLVLCLYWFGNSGLPPEMKAITGLAPSLQSNWLMMHVSVMMLSYATLILGSLLSLLFLILDFYSSKQKKTAAFSSSGTALQKNEVLTNNFIQFSLLEIIDIWSYRLIGLGFPFLTLGIISGAVWANEAWGAYWSWDPKESWALITWLVFAIYLHTRLIKGWNGKKTAAIGSLGFVIIWICYLGVNFLGKGLHSYGWIS